jgi:hypothetical protein
VLIDLGKLREMHPRLPVEIAHELMTRAALGLARHEHRPGVAVHLEVEDESHAGSLSWAPAAGGREQHDEKRITEDGAEAVALAFAHRFRGWSIVRRMQQEERADWLLEQGRDADRQTVALEISGVDRGAVSGRLRQKLSQVSGALDVDERWAAVVGFQAPQAILRSTEARDG